MARGLGSMIPRWGGAPYPPSRVAPSSPPAAAALLSATATPTIDIVDGGGDVTSPADAGKNNGVSGGGDETMMDVFNRRLRWLFGKSVDPIVDLISLDDKPAVPTMGHYGLGFKQQHFNDTFSQLHLSLRFSAWMVHHTSLMAAIPFWVHVRMFTVPAALVLGAIMVATAVMVGFVIRCYKAAGEQQGEEEEEEATNNRSRLRSRLARRAAMIAHIGHALFGVIAIAVILWDTPRLWTLESKARQDFATLVPSLVILIVTPGAATIFPRCYLEGCISLAGSVTAVTMILIKFLIVGSPDLRFVLGMCVGAGMFASMVAWINTHTSLNVFQERVRCRITELRASQALGDAISATRRSTAQIAHDVGTPLAALQLCCDEVMALSRRGGGASGEEGEEDPAVMIAPAELAEVAKIAITCCRTIAQLRRMMMDEAKLVAGRALQPRQETMDVAEALDEVRLMTKSKAESAGMILDMSTDDPNNKNRHDDDDNNEEDDGKDNNEEEALLPLAESIITDPVWYKSMLMNYVSNATSAAESKIHIKTMCVRRVVAPGADDDAGSFLFRTEVHDDGTGVSEEAASRAFKMYGRGQQRDDGNGVGLYSVKVQSEALGGGAGFGTSALLGGAVFWFQVAYRPSVAPLAPASTDEEEVDAGPATTVLVVDDDAIVLHTVSRVLSHAGHTVTCAMNGRIGLKEMQRQEFGLVLSDLQMPILDGHEMVKRMRRWEQHRERRQPIVVMSANSSKTDRKGAMVAGADGFLAKPSASCQILSTVRKQVEAHGQPKPPPSPAAGGAAGRATEVRHAEESGSPEEAAGVVEQQQAGAKHTPAINSPAAATGSCPRYNEEQEAKNDDDNDDDDLLVVVGGGAATPPSDIDFGPMRTALYAMYKEPAFVPDLLEMALAEYVSDLAELEAHPHTALAQKLKGAYQTIFFSQAVEVAARIEGLLKRVPPGATASEVDEFLKLGGGGGLFSAMMVDLRRCQTLLEEAVGRNWFNWESARDAEEEAAVLLQAMQEEEAAKEALLRPPPDEIDFTPMRAALRSMYKEGGAVLDLLMMAIPELASLLNEFEAHPSAALAHKLKGSFRMIYFPEAGEVAFGLEMLLRGVSADAGLPYEESERLAAGMVKMQRCQVQLEAALGRGWFDDRHGLHAPPTSINGGGGRYDDDTTDDTTDDDTQQ